MALCPFATIGLLASASAGGPWVRPSTRSSNRPSNRPTNRPSIQPTQIVVHTLESTARAADWRFRRAETLGQAAGQSHFGVGRDGTIVQWIDTGSRADATHQANRRADGTGAVALTTEGGPWQPWTAAQLTALTRLHLWLLRTHPSIGHRVCRSAADPGLGHHTLFGAWTARNHRCPGAPRVAQWQEILVPRVLAAVGTRYGAPTVDQLAVAFVAELAGEDRDVSPFAEPWAADGSGPPAVEPADPPRALEAAPAPPELPAATPAVSPSGTAPSASGEADPGPPTIPSHVVRQAVRDFFLPDSAPKRDQRP